MAQTIDEADYDIEVRNKARELSEAVEDTGEDALNLLVDVLDAHPWFSKRELSYADYGAIVGDFSHYNGNVEEYRDPETMTEGDDFPTVLRKMAFGQFEADVYECYKLEDFE